MKNRLSEILENIKNISDDDMYFLENLRNKYPYFHLAHILYLKKLESSEYIKYTNNLEKISLLSPSRVALFKFLHNDIDLNCCCETKIEEKSEPPSNLKYGIRIKKENINEEEISTDVIEILRDNDLKIERKFVNKEKWEKNRERIYKKRKVNIKKVERVREIEEIRKEEGLISPPQNTKLDINITLNNQDILLLNEIKQEILEVNYLLENREIPENSEEQIDILQNLLLEYKPLLLVHSSYVTALTEENKEEAINGSIIYSKNIDLIKKYNKENIISLFKEELKEIESIIPNDINYNLEEEKQKIINFLDENKNLKYIENDNDIKKLIDSKNNYDLELLDNLLLKLNNYKEDLLTELQEKSKIKFHELRNIIEYKKYYTTEYLSIKEDDNNVPEILEIIDNLNNINDFIMYLLDMNMYLPLKYIDKEIESLKKTIPNVINNKFHYLENKILLYKGVISDSLEKINDINISKDQKKINIVFKNISVNIENKYIENYNENILDLLEIVSNNDLKIVDYSVLEEFENKGNSPHKYIKYIEGRPIKNIDLKSIEKDNNLYIKITVLIDYYKKELYKLIKDDDFTNISNYQKLELLKNISDKLSILSTKKVKNILDLFIDLFNVNIEIQKIKYEVIEINKESEITHNFNLIDDLINDFRYLKIKYLFYLKGKNLDKNLLKEGKNTIKIDLKKEDLKFISNGQNVFLQKFVENVEKIEESFKIRFKILGKKNEYRIFHKEEVKPVKDKEIKNNIIDRFIQSNITSIPKIKLDEKKENIKEDIIIKNDIPNLATETLIKMYIKQKKYDLAIRAYKILLSQSPSNALYYKNKIKEIENLKKEDNGK